MASPAAARSITGHVYIDEDSDGLLSAGDTAVSDVVVAVDPEHSAVTGPDGRYQLEAPTGEAIVWVRTSDGFAPGRSWAPVPAQGDVALDLVLVPAAQQGPLRFVVAADTHTGYATLAFDELASAIDQLGAAEPDAHFVVITGDLSQRDRPEQYAGLAGALRDIAVPFVPVPGNHDWADGGDAYRAAFGPSSYSFDAGGAHFVVLNDAKSLNDREAFLQWDRALVADDRMTIAFMHAPPRPDVLAVLNAAEVDYLFTGHLHANRLLLHDSIVELNTEPLALGGIDLTPSGFRVVSLAGDETLRIEHVTIREGTPVSPDVDVLPPSRPAAVANWPQLQGGPLHHGTAARGIELPLVVAWTRDVGATLLRGSPVVADGRVFVSMVDLDDGADGGVVALDARDGSELWRYVTGFAVRGAPAVDANTVVIAASDGTLHAVDATTGTRRWNYSLGEGAEPRLRGLYGAATIVDSVVYAALSREIVAIDLASGVPLWQQPLSQGNTWYGSHVTPAVAADLVVTSLGNGGAGLRAWSAASGAPVWQTSRSIAVGMTASPVIADDTVYVLNELTHMAAIDLFTGETRWRRKLHPDGFDNGHGATATPAFADGTLFVPTQHGALFAVDALSGAELWRLDAGDALIRTATNRGRVAAFAAAPAIAGDLLWIGGADGRLAAVDLESGQVVYSRQLGAPIMSGVVPAPPMLYVTTFDGVVHAFAPPDLSVPTVSGEPRENELSAGEPGCSCRVTRPDAGGGSGGTLLVLIAVVAALGRRAGRAILLTGR